MAAILTIGALALLPGCGGSSDSKPERLANVKPSYDTSCPEKWNTETSRGSIFNAVPGSYSMKISVPRDSYDCADWSGVSTPGRAFDGKSISIGYPGSFRLEYNSGRFGSLNGGPWTMNVWINPTRAGEKTSSRFETLFGDVWCCGRKFAPTTDWGDPKVYYITVGTGGLRRDSDPEVVKDACSKDPKAFGLGVYNERLSWLFCYQRRESGA